MWSERIAGRLKGWHLIFFWLGLACDTIGTAIMMDYAGGLTADVHGVTGVAAILLMIIHAIWATVVLARKDERAISQLPQVQRRRLGHLADPVLFWRHHGDEGVRK